MSAETKAALDAALAAHMADEVGEATMLTGYVIHASHVSAASIDSGSTMYFAEYAERQPFHVCLGLAVQLTSRLKTELVEGDD